MQIQIKKNILASLVLSVYFDNIDNDLASYKLQEAINFTNKEVDLGNEDLSNSRIRKIKKKYSKEYLSIFLWREKVAIQENLPPKKILKDENIKKLIHIIEENNVKECDWIIKEDKHRIDFLKNFK